MNKKEYLSKIIASMTLEEKTGQLFILAFPGKETGPACEMIERFGIGGCYISQDNSETFEEARKLSEKLQNVALSKNPNLPLILGVDQEGAWGNLIPEAVIGPGNLALGRTDDTTFTEELYGIFAREMLSVGYQTILAPCADINLNPQNPIIGTRSFGENPERVAKHTAQAVKALKQNGAISTVKHFPGHGDTHSDSHRDIPVVDKPLETLEKEEFLPFRSAIDAGVDIIMTAHILFPRLDSQFPATLSPIILTDLLRRRMGFQGVVITDSMNMGAIRKHFSPEEAAIKALEAGADLIMLSEEHYDHSEDYFKHQICLVQSVLSAIKNGRVSENLLNEKLTRILQLKLKIAETGMVGKICDQKSRQNSRITEKKAAAAAVQILRNSNHAFPLRKKQRIALINATPQTSYSNLMNARGIGPNQAEPAFKGFAELFEKNGFCFDAFSYEDATTTDFGAYSKILIVTEDHPLPGEDFEKSKQIELVQKLVREHNGKLLILGLRSPYDLLRFPEAAAYICAYSGRTCSAKAAADFFLNAMGSD